MKRLLIILVVATAFVYGPYNTIAANEVEEAGAQVELGGDNDLGVFCSIQAKEVCVLAQTELDCKKLEGKKVDACPHIDSRE